MNGQCGRPSSLERQNITFGFVYSFNILSPPVISSQIVHQSNLIHQMQFDCHEFVRFQLPSHIRHKHPRKHHLRRLARHRHIHAPRVRLLRAKTMRRNSTIQREPARRLPNQRQRGRRTLVDLRAHGAGLRDGVCKRGREGGGRGGGKVGDGAVDGVGGDGVEGGAGGEGGEGGGDGGEGGDGEHGVLEGEDFAGDGEAGEADGGGEGESEGVGVGGAPEAVAGVAGGDGGGDGRGGGFAGAVDEGDAFGVLVGWMVIGGGMLVGGSLR